MNHETWAKLTDEQKRIKVAELCGYHGCHWDGPSDYSEFVPTSKDGVPKGYWLGKVPGYLNDLNAMHEALKQITSPAQHYTYLGILYRLYGNTNALNWAWQEHNATAAQRAEAFVLTMEPES